MLSVWPGLQERWGIPVEHGIKSCDFVHPHGWHGKKFGDIVHDADACPSLVLPLCEVEERYNGRFLILGWVVGNDLICLSEVFGAEFEGDLCVDNRVSETSKRIQNGVADLRVVVCGVPVLSNRKVRICVGVPGVKNDLRRIWRRKT